MDDRAAGSVTFHLCPSGHCCPESEAGGCEYDHCEGGRVGVLCGQCPEGAIFLGYMHRVMTIRQVTGCGF